MFKTDIATDKEDLEAVPERPPYLQKELDSLSQLKVNFSRKYKRTFKAIEACKSEAKANQMAQDMYLELMQKVLKKAGVDRASALLERLEKKRKEQGYSSDGDSNGDEIEHRIKESIHSVRESLENLKNRLEQNKHIELEQEIERPKKAKYKTRDEEMRMKKRELKLEAKKEKKLAEEQNHKGGSWSPDEIQRFIEAVHKYKKSFKEI